jgi:AGZA family xanthine/uracil permease-like MFS transporter
LKKKKKGENMKFLKEYFHIEERKSSIWTEVVGGLVTFLAMLYILPVNADILSGQGFVDTGMPFGGVFVATAIAAGIATILMGFIGKVPIALASGMGINAFFTFTIIGSLGFTYQEALAAVFLSGLLFLIISLTGLRKLVINAIPRDLKLAIGAGIGFFIAFIGLKNSGVIVASLGTFVELGNLSNPTVMLALFGILLVLILHTSGGKLSKFAVIISMLIVGFGGALLGVVFPGLAEYMPSLTASNPGAVTEAVGLFGQAFSGLGSLLSNPLAYPVIITLLFVDFFDTAGTLVSVGHQAGLIDEEGKLIGNDKALLVDSVGTVFGAFVGTSTVTSYIESNTGIQAGAKTGLSSVVTGVLFLFAILLYPLFGFVDAVFVEGVAYSPVTSLALVFVGILMMKPLKEINFEDPVILASSFMTIIMMILTFKISEGIAFGFITYSMLMGLSKRRKEVHWMVYVLGLFFLLHLVVYFTYIV